MLSTHTSKSNLMFGTFSEKCPEQKEPFNSEVSMTIHFTVTCRKDAD